MAAINARPREIASNLMKQKTVILEAISLARAYRRPHAVGLLLVMGLTAEEQVHSTAHSLGIDH